MVSDDQNERADGVRFELRLLKSEEGAASYRVSLRAHQREWVGDVDLTPPLGEVSFHFTDSPEPPAPLLSIVRAQMRMIYRERERAGFPRRVTRWRPLPSANESE
ncbi:MAG TPA: hypothetical protein VFQ35_07520 [Polyangiaceae bacterium]|nr:hypothetical protein [Polyangiaceae bacterium]